MSHSNRPDKSLLFEAKKCCTCDSTSLQCKRIYRRMYDFDGDRMHIITYGVRITKGICKK